MSRRGASLKQERKSGVRQREEAYQEFGVGTQMQIVPSPDSVMFQNFKYQIRAYLQQNVLPNIMVYSQRICDSIK